MIQFDHFYTYEDILRTNAVRGSAPHFAQPQTTAIAVPLTTAHRTPP